MDVQKIAVFDERIVQKNPVMYAVEQGAVSVTNMNFAAISQTSSQQSFQVQAPSENIYLSRSIDWGATCYLQFNVNFSPTADLASSSGGGTGTGSIYTLIFATAQATIPYAVGQTIVITAATPASINVTTQVLSCTTTSVSFASTETTAQTVAANIATSTNKKPATGDPVITFGKDIALSAFPLHNLVSVLNATINDTTVSTNLSDVLWEISRLSDSAKNRSQRTCPTYLDNFANYNDAYDTNTNAIAGYGSSIDKNTIPNGAFWNVQFTSSDGKNVVTAPVATSSATSYPVYIKFTSVEKLMVSPFVWNDADENSTGLSQIQNIQVVMNMVNPSLTNTAGRVLRYNTRTIAGISSLQYNSNAPNGGFSDSKLQCLFLTPSLSLPLSPVSRVQYLEYPRFKQSFTGVSTLSANNTGGVKYSSNTYTLPSIPDAIVIYAKPQSYADGTQADWYFPINNISVNFDNYSGLLSSLSNAQLYSLSQYNGIDTDWNSWNGICYNSKNYMNQLEDGNKQTSQLIGSPLILKPGKDITLQVGQAPGLQGQFTIQFDFTLTNPTATAYSSFDLYILTINSGFFESIKGSSRVQKNVLTQKDIIDADNKGSLTKPDIERLVGGAQKTHKFSSLLPGVMRHFLGKHHGSQPMPMPIHSGRGISKRLM